jgi:hypothetical protein
MIAETKLVKSIGEFFSRLLQSKKEKKEKDNQILRESYVLLKELEETWHLPLSNRKDFVDYTNLLLQKVQDIRIRKNKAIARQIRRFARRNCLAGVIPDSELERAHKETVELLEKMELNWGQHT